MNPRNKSFWKNEIFLVGPIIFFAIYFNLFNKFPKGIRHYLVVFPFVLILSGYAVTGWNSFTKRKKMFALLGCIHIAASVLSYFPHYIPYFNEFVLPRKNAYKILADSNLDWGQSELYLDRFLRANPEAKFHPEEPTSGTIVVSPNFLIGILGSPEEFKWLRDCHEPFGTIAYTYLIYDIQPGFEGCGLK